MRRSQGRKAAPSRNPASPYHALTKPACTASSASPAEPPTPSASRRAGPSCMRSSEAYASTSPSFARRASSRSSGGRPTTASLRQSGIGATRSRRRARRTATTPPAPASASTAIAEMITDTHGEPFEAASARSGDAPAALAAGARAAPAPGTPRDPRTPRQPAGAGPRHTPGPQHVAQTEGRRVPASDGRSLEDGLAGGGVDQRTAGGVGVEVLADRSGLLGARHEAPGDGVPGPERPGRRLLGERRRPRLAGHDVPEPGQGGQPASVAGGRGIQWVVEAGASDARRLDPLGPRRAGRSHRSGQRHRTRAGRHPHPGSHTGPTPPLCPWFHRYSAAQEDHVQQTVDTTPVPQGLTDAEVADRIESGRVNRAPGGTSRSLWAIVRANVFTRFNAILGALLVIILTIGPLQDALFGVVLVTNTGIGIYQEWRAKRTLDRLSLLTAPAVTVARNGGRREISPEDVVDGDVVELGRGTQIVADGEVLSADALEVDESLLSGESVPEAKAPGDEVLSGSFVSAGQGWYRADRIGAESYANQLSAEARRFSLVRSELRRGTDQILRLVTWLIIPTAILLIFSQLAESTDDSLGDAIRGTVAGVGSMIPEGLVLLTSIAFTAGVLRLGHRQVLVQELAAIEGLARVDIVCTDKTGTLTELGLEVADLHALDDADEADAESALGALAAADPEPNA